MSLNRENVPNFKLFSFQTALTQFRLFPITYKVALAIASVAIFSFALLQVPITWWASASFVTALLMQYAMVVFSWVFPENARTPRRRAAILFAPGLVFIPTAIAGILWHKVGFESGRFVIDLTPLAYSFVLYLYFVFAYGSIVLYRKYQKYRGTLPGQQVGAIVWGLLITGVLKTIAIIVLPYFGNYDLLPLSSLFVLPGVVIYAYAILNFKLFSFQTALTQKFQTILISNSAYSVPALPDHLQGRPRNSVRCDIQFCPTSSPDNLVGV